MVGPQFWGHRAHFLDGNDTFVPQTCFFYPNVISRVFFARPNKSNKKSREITQVNKKQEITYHDKSRKEGEEQFG